MYEDPLTIEPEGAASACVIWLHGLGADGNDFVPIVEELGLPADHGIRFVFPHAPERPVTVNGGYVMRAWFDIYGHDLLDEIDDDGIASSAEYLNELVERQEASGIPADRIVLAGFSQGGVIALNAALGSGKRLAGVLALSTYLPDTELTPVEGLPVFVGHGSHDDVVPLIAGEGLAARLDRQGAAVEWHKYPMGHQVTADEIADMAAWFGRVL